MDRMLVVLILLFALICFGIACMEIERRINRNERERRELKRAPNKWPRGY
jgi:hypothetical protein